MRSALRTGRLGPARRTPERKSRPQVALVLPANDAHRPLKRFAPATIRRRAASAASARRTSRERGTRCLRTKGIVGRPNTRTPSSFSLIHQPPRSTSLVQLCAQQQRRPGRRAIRIFVVVGLLRARSRCGAGKLRNAVFLGLLAAVLLQMLAGAARSPTTDSARQGRNTNTRRRYSAAHTASEPSLGLRPFHRR